MNYRNEPDPVKGRHDLIFLMFEFEMLGSKSPEKIKIILIQ